MAFTKVVGPGIHTLSNILSHNINSSGIITATKFVGPFDNAIIGGGTTISSDGINVTGIVTATELDINGNGDISGNLVVGGNLTANGDFTTLNTTLREVELLRVDADSNAAAGIVTQRGAGDILNLYDDSTEVLTVINGGKVGVGTIAPTHVIHSYGEGNLGGVRLENSHSTTTVSGNTAATAFPHNLILSNYSGLGSANDRIASIGFDVPTTGTYANATIAYQATNAGTGDLQFHLESGNTLSERVRFTSSGKILTGNPVVPSHAESASLIVVSANTGAGVTHALSDSSAIYNHSNPSFLAVQNRYDTGTGQESGIIFSQKHLEQGSWAIYGKRTGSYVSDLIFRNRTGATASAERLRIDSDGRLLIGRSSAFAHADADNLIVGNEATNEHQGITILSHTGKYGGIYFGDGDGATGSNRGKIIYDHPNDQLRIGTGGVAATQFYITSSGKVGVNEGSPLAKLHVKEGDSGVTSADAEQDTLFLENNGNAGLTIATPNANTGYLTFADPEDSNVGQIIYRHGGTYANSMAFFVNADERLSITSGGQVRIGNANNLGLWGQNNRLQVAGTDWNTSGITIACMSNSGSANLVMGNSKASTPGGSGGALTQDNRLGYISFVGDDGTDMNTVGAAIVAELDSNASSNSMPGRLRFYTGGNSNERLRITSSGKAIFSEEIETPQDYPVHKPSLDLNFARVKKLDTRFTFRRSGPASYVDENGYVKIVGANMPRFDHDPVTRESKGLLAEQDAANWIKYGTNLTQTGWGANNVTHTIAATEVAPDGNTGSVSEQKENTNNSYHASYIDMSIPMTSGQYYTVSTWLKKGPNYRTNLNGGNYQLYCSRGTGSVAYVTINSDFDALSSHSNTTARSLTKYRNGWIRVTYSFQSNQNSSNTMPHWLLGNGGSYAGDGANSVYIWGCQFESMRFPTSYIPTYGSVVYRGADVVTLDRTELTDVFNTVEGTSVVYAHMPNNSGSAGMAAYAFKNSSDSNVHLGFSRDSGSDPAYHYYHDGSNSGYSRASATTNNLYKGALSFKTGDLDSYVNGSLNSNTTTFTMPTIDNLRIGGTTGPNYLGGHVARFMYYPVKLTNNQLATLTS